jgi:hypothetical protein
LRRAREGRKGNGVRREDERWLMRFYCRLQKWIFREKKIGRSKED